MDEKRCTKCGETKSTSEFHKDGRLASGLRADCKSCHNASVREYQKQHREERAVYNCAYQRRHAEEIGAYKAERYQQHAEENRAYAHGYRQQHVEERKAYNTRYQQQHVEEQRAYLHEYRQLHAAEIQVYNAEYRQQHIEELRAHDREYRKTDAGRASGRAHTHNRRIQGGPRITRELVQEVIAASSDGCPYCGTLIVEGHIDHMLPLSRGGTNARSNLKYVCAPCNQAKHTQTVEEFCGILNSN